MCTKFYKVFMLLGLIYQRDESTTNIASLNAAQARFTRYNIMW